jgi:hypothetical protein
LKAAKNQVCQQYILLFHNYRVTHGKKVIVIKLKSKSTVLAGDMAFTRGRADTADQFTRE